MHDIETMCREKGRQLLLVWFLNYLPLTVPYSKPCPGHNSLTVWNIFMKLYRCMHDIEMMCHEKGRQHLLVWFLYARLKNGTYYVTGYGVRPSLRP